MPGLNGKKYISILVTLIFCLSTFLCPAYVEAQGTKNSQDDGSLAEDEYLKDDLSQTLDTTIKILSILKEELKTEESEVSTIKSGTKDADAEGDWAETFSRLVRKITRVWKKIRKEVKPTPPGLAKKGEDPGLEGEALTKDIKMKLDKTIKAMQVIQRELKKLEKEEALEKE